MATLILSTIGTAIGGPIGSAVGAFIGQQIDSAIFGVGGNREGPRLKELSVTTSSYGRPIARHFGRMRVAGTIIWSTDLLETQSKEGGGKGRPSTTTYSYSASFAVALSSTPIDRIGRIWADGNLLRGSTGDLKVGGDMRAYLGTGDHSVDPLISAAKGELAPGFRDSAYVVFEDLQLADFGNRIPALTFEIFASQDQTVSLGQLVPESVGASADVILQHAKGFSDEGGALSSSIAAIDRVFPISCTTTADGLRFETLNQIPEAVPTLPEPLAQIEANASVEREKRRGETLGREPLALRYYDEERDYQPSVQRALGMRPDGRESVIDLPATMTASGARELANSNAQRTRWHNEQMVWRIGELDPRIAPGSVVRVPDVPGVWLVRNWEWFDRGIELNLERLAPAIDGQAPSDAGTANSPLDVAIPPTLLLVAEVPPESPSNGSNTVILAAGSAEQPGWRGASLFLDQADTLARIGSTGTRRATMGSLVGNLAGAVSTHLQPEAVLNIDLVAPDMHFSSTDLTGLAMGLNRLLLGAEVIQFLTATHQGGGHWQLKGLLRGRAGTEDFASEGHLEGTPILLLDDTANALDAELVQSDPTTRIAAIGLGDNEPVFANLQNVGLSRRPAMPVHPRHQVLGNGDWEMCWIRRARGNWRWTEALEVPLVEETELYWVGYGPVNNPYAIWPTSEPRLVVSASEIVTLFANHGPSDFWVRQIGTYGQSAPLLLVNTN